MDREEIRGSNLEKDPKEWTTGDERMTDAQASYLKTLSDEAGEPFDENLRRQLPQSASTSYSERPAAAKPRRAPQRGRSDSSDHPKTLDRSS
jgi:hypothetical protein